MTVGELIQKLTQAPYDPELAVFVDDAYGSETWKIEGVKIGTSRVFIEVGERYDSDDEDHEDDPDGDWRAFLDSGPQAERLPEE